MKLLSVVGSWAGALALIVVAAPVAAQQDKGGAGKIAYVNTQAILKHTPPAEEAGGADAGAPAARVGAGA